MSGVVSDALKGVGNAVQSLVIDRIQSYVNYIKNCERNLATLQQKLEALCLEKHEIDEEVMIGKDKLEKITGKASLWLGSVRELTSDVTLRKLMIKDFQIAKLGLKLMEDDLKKLVDEDTELRELVVEVMKDITITEPGNEVADKDKEVAKVLEKLMKETVQEFKNIMKNDANMAVAAMHLLEDHEDLGKLTSEDKDMAEIVQDAKKIVNHEEENFLKDIRASESRFRTAVRNLVKPVGGMIVDEAFLNGLPENVRLGVKTMSVVVGNMGKVRADIAGSVSRQSCHCGCGLFFEHFRELHDMSLAAELMVQRIKPMIENPPVRPVTRPRRMADLDAIPTLFVGLESREELLMKMVKTLSEYNVSTVGAYGMGGSGKTTLAKEVSTRVKDVFDTIVIVEISETPNIKRIQNEIADALGLTLGDMHSIPQRAIKLYNRLKPEQSEGSKKKLLILDNIWRQLNLQEVGIPRDYCKLLLTSREKAVCKTMGILQSNIFEVGLLNDKEARELFQNQVEKRVLNGEHKCLADRLLSKCGGLPLTIVTTANALKGQDLPFWRNFVDNLEKPISSQVSGVHRETYSILKTSYEVMEIKEKKMFFVLACLSPSGSSISIEQLMRYGIGLDLFQHVNNLSEAMEQGKAWAEELVSSSLLLEDDFEGGLRIHDVVRASAISFIEKEQQIVLVGGVPRWMCEETFKKFTAISLWSGYDFSRLSGVKADMLQILLLMGDISSKPLDSDFFQGMVNLKVLALSNMNFKCGIPKTMGELKHLKTLHMHLCLLQNVGLIGKLSNLLVLSFRRSTLEAGLSKDIGNLCNLRLLDMSDCKGNLYIPANILSRLSELEGLYLLDSFSDWANCEETEGTHSVGETSERAASTKELVKLPHLNVLEMHVPKLNQLLNNGQIIENMSKSSVYVGDLNELDIRKIRQFQFQHVLKLNKLYMSVCLQNDSLKALLKKVVWLEVIDCSGFENLFPELDEEGFKNSKILQVKGCEDIRYLVNSNKLDSSPPFMNLESLELSALRNLEKVCECYGIQPPRMFSNLQSLKLERLPKLAYVLSVHALGSLNLIELSICVCESFEFIFVKNYSEEASSSSKADGIENEAYSIGLLPRLKRLDVLNTKLMCVLGTLNDSVIVQAEHPFFNEMSMCQSLESLSLKYSHLNKSLWSRNAHISGFWNLKTITLKVCDRLEYLGPPSMIAKLVHLEQLSIGFCCVMKEVISKEIIEDEIVEHTILFPRLKLLELHQMFRLELFYRGNYRLEFPSLQKLSIKGNDNMSRFVESPNLNAFFSDKVEFPLLEELGVEDVAENFEGLWDWSKVESHGGCAGMISFKPVPKLRNLCVGSTKGLRFIPLSISQNLFCFKVSDFKDIKTLFSSSPPNKQVFCTYSQLPNLTELVASKFDYMQELLEDRDDDDVAAINFCQQITFLSLKVSKNLNVIPLHLFKNLRELYLQKLSWKFLISANLVKTGSIQIQSLEILEIEDCNNMMAVIEDDGDSHRVYYEFPQLKRLHLSSLAMVTGFCSRPSADLNFPSLEELTIYGSNKLKSFCSGCFIAPKLKRLELKVCYEMQYFLGGDPVNQDNDSVIVHQLLNLENVGIYSCVLLLSFSSQPLALPKLRQVTLYACVELEVFLSGYRKNSIQLLPSLEALSINLCTSMKSLSSTPIAAPKFTQLEIDHHFHVKLANEELVNLLNRLRKDEGEERTNKDEQGIEEEDDSGVQEEEEFPAAAPGRI